MKIYHEFNRISEDYPDIIFALGNFDGVHLGHRELIRVLVSRSKEMGCTPAVMTFDPHPLTVLEGKKPPMLLSRDDKISMLGDAGAEVILFAPFNREFAELTPEKFVIKILKESLNSKGVIIGYNYHFGKKCSGSPETMVKLGGQLGIFVDIVPPVVIGNTVVSSTLIRRFIMEGLVDRAKTLLGYFPFTRGKVVGGDRRGRQIGFPTANLDIPEDIIVPAKGVYAVRVEANNKIYGGIANIGLKPTIKPENRLMNIEVHIFNFDDNIYGKNIKIEYIKMLRGEKCFSSIDELVDQIGRDRDRAKEILDGL